MLAVGTAMTAEAVVAVSVAVLMHSQVQSCAVALHAIVMQSVVAAATVLIKM
jgi:hypothetical protein